MIEYFEQFIVNLYQIQLKTHTEKLLIEVGNVQILKMQPARS